LEGFENGRFTVSGQRLLEAHLRLAATALAILFSSTAAWGDISGFVRVADTGTPGVPVQGARVHARADLSVVAVTGADGSFTLPLNPDGFVELAASVPYNRAAATNYLIGGNFAVNGATDVDIRLAVLPVADNPNYEPPTADNCGSCHASVYPRWAGSNHADAARNEWVLDLFSGSGTPGGGAGYVCR
jgi:hypothetical protein